MAIASGEDTAVSESETPKCEECGLEYEAEREVDSEGNVCAWTAQCDCEEVDCSPDLCPDCGKELFMVHFCEKRWEEFADCIHCGWTDDPEEETT